MLQEFDSLISMVQVLSDEKKCVDHFRAVRWPKGVACPHCGSVKVYILKNNTHKCGEAECSQKFSVRYDTIFEDSKLPLQKWFMAMYLEASNKKGISSCQLARDLKVTQKTAWYMLHRIRIATADESPEPLTGVVEVDETYIGGKEKNKHSIKRTRSTHGAGSLRTGVKVGVLGMVARDGKLRMQIIEKTTSDVIRPIMLANVCTSSIINTDEGKTYMWVQNRYREHHIVTHGSNEYVRGTAYTNTIEGVFSHLKRTITGVYHQTSKKHLQRYLNMFAWRWNSRDMEIGERINGLLKSTIGRRLTYKELVYG